MRKFTAIAVLPHASWLPVPGHAVAQSVKPRFVPRRPADPRTLSQTFVQGQATCSFGRRHELEKKRTHSRWFPRCRHSCRSSWLFCRPLCSSRRCCWPELYCICSEGGCLGEGFLRHFVNSVSGSCGLVWGVGEGCLRVTAHVSPSVWQDAVCRGGKSHSCL
jgi:hypothetical protein